MVCFATPRRELVNRVPLLEPAIAPFRLSACSSFLWAVKAFARKVRVVMLSHASLSPGSSVFQKHEAEPQAPNPLGEQLLLLLAG